MNIAYSLIILFLCFYSHPSHAGDKDTGILKVGIVLPLSGSQKAYGQEAKASIELSLDDFMAENPDFKNKVILLWADDKGLPSEARKQSLDLVRKKRIHFLFGSVSTPSSKEIAIVAQENKIPMISPVSSNPLITDIGPYIFSTRESLSHIGEAYAKFAKQFKSATIIYEESSKHSSELFLTKFQNLGGTAVSKYEHSQYQKALQTNAEVIYFNLRASPKSINLLKKIQKKSSAAILLHKSWKFSKLKDTIKNFKKLYFISDFHLNTQAPKALEFKSKFKSKTKRFPSILATFYYDGFQYIVEDFKTVKTIRPKPLLRGITKLDYANGLLGPLTIKDSKFASKSFSIYTIEKNSPKEIMVIPAVEIKDPKG